MMLTIRFAISAPVLMMSYAWLTGSSTTPTETMRKSLARVASQLSDVFFLSVFLTGVFLSFAFLSCVFFS